MHAQEDNSKPKIEWSTEYHLVPFYVFLEKETLICSFFHESEMSVNSDNHSSKFQCRIWFSYMLQMDKRKHFGCVFLYCVKSTCTCIVTSHSIDTDTYLIIVN